MIKDEIADVNSVPFNQDQFIFKIFDSSTPERKQKYA